MPHRNLNDTNKLHESVKQLSQAPKDKHIIIAGDFNFPNINWNTMSVNKGAADQMVQESPYRLCSRAWLNPSTPSTY